MKIRYVWQAHSLTFKTLKAARAWCALNRDGMSIIARVKVGEKA